jgi:hypothetical protein
LVLGLRNRKEAERFLEQLQKRLADYGLELHWKKTRLIQFGHRKREGKWNQKRSIFWASSIFAVGSIKAASSRCIAKRWASGWRQNSG